VRFCVTGGTSAALDFALLALLLNVRVPHRAALVTAFIAGVVVNFVMHRYFTFRLQGTTSIAELVRYLIVVALNVILTLVTVELFLLVVGRDVLVGKLISIPLVTLNGFVLAKFFIFEGRARGRSPNIPPD
jgi:putative flippase GtrA